MTSRVARVAVRLKLAETERDLAEQTQRTVERVVLQHAVDEIERVIDARFGQAAIVRVRRLAFRWRLERAELEQPEVALAMGRELAASILDELEAAPRPLRLRPIDAANAVMFETEEHAVAAALADAAEGTRAWFYPQALEVRRVWEAVQTSGAPAVAAVATWLARMDRTAVVVALLADSGIPPIELAALATAVVPVSVSSSSPSSMDRVRLPATVPARAPTRDRDGEERGMIAVDEHVGEAHDTADAIEELAGAMDPVHTDAAAVFYLVRLVQQLGLGELLWAIGVHEGEVLAHVAAAILGTDLRDPAWRWFGGAYDRAPVHPAIADWAAAELLEKLAASLARELGSVAGGCLDVPPRIACDALTAQVIVRCADALCRLWCARLGCEPDIAAVRAALCQAGMLELDDRTLRVTMPMAALDIDIRRAGLDFDPGYVPWLSRTVEIVFAPDRGET
ncbi:MAG: hypothetical protein ABI867_07940 [Kofleriaceae bacterium]